MWYNARENTGESLKAKLHRNQVFCCTGRKVLCNVLRLYFLSLLSDNYALNLFGIWNYVTLWRKFFLPKHQVYFITVGNQNSVVGRGRGSFNWQNGTKLIISTTRITGMFFGWWIRPSTNLTTISQQSQTISKLTTISQQVHDNDTTISQQVRNKFTRSSQQSLSNF